MVMIYFESKVPDAYSGQPIYSILHRNILNEPNTRLAPLFRILA